MSIGRVIGYVIQYDADITLVGGCYQRVEVRQRTEERLDVRVLGNVVTEVRHRRRENGRDPDAVDAEPLQILEAAGDTRQVAGAVAVAVHKGAWVNLIDESTLPPGGHADCSLAPGGGRRWARSTMSSVYSKYVAA